MDKIDIRELEKNIKNVIVFEYVPIRNQLAMINNIVNELVVENIHGIFEYNKVDRTIMETVSIVSLFTNIDITDNDLDNYDYIMKNGLFEYFELDRNESISNFKILLHQAINDKMKENGYEYILAKKSDDIVRVFDKTMDHVNGMLDKGDPNIIAKYLSKVANTFVSKMPDFSKIDIFSKELIKDEKSN